MAQIAHPLPAGPTTDAEVSAFEKYIGHKLPAEYRQFLLQHNGGHPEPEAFLLNAGYGEEENIVMCFFPMRDLKIGDVSVDDLEGLRTWPLHCAWNDLRGDLENLYSGAGIEEPLLPIGTDGSGNYICLVLAAARTGAVVFLDHETGETHPLAKSFTGFLGSLRQCKQNDNATGSERREPGTTFEKIGTLVTSGACVQCGGSGKCYCIRKGQGDPTGCARCNGSGKCGVCQGFGKARR